jgi:hypothetical protein
VIDPYTTLGLRPGASLDEVKQAYRRLAKRYHPDAAGGEATADFLAIQAAYESIAGSSRKGGRSSRSAARPWQADAARARATRDAYRWRSSPGSGGTRGPDDGAGQGRTSAGAWWRTGAGASSGSAGSAGGTRGAGASDGDSAKRARSESTGRGRPKAGRRASSTGAAGRTPGAGRARRTTIRRKATLNSTSYDEAAQQPFAPDWDGGSWYGPSSGTYWTINPREYADPRKHGPEYQARARRASGAEPVERTVPDPQAPDPQVPDERTEEPPTPWATREPDAALESSSTRRPPAASRFASTSTVPGDPGDRPPARPSEAQSGMGSGPALGPSRPLVASSRPGSALSLGIAAGAVTAVPAGVVWLGSVMAGEPGPAAIAIVLPLAVGTVTALVALIARRPRTEGQ